MKEIKLTKVLKLSLIIFLGALLTFNIPVNNIAYGADNIKRQAHETYKNNNIYKDNIFRNNNVLHNAGIMDSSNVPVFDTIDEGVDYLRNQMVKREPEINFTINSGYKNGLAKEILDKAFSYDDKLSSDEGDYLLQHFSQSSISIEYTDTKSTYFYHMEYLTSYEQECEVKKEVRSVLDKLNVYNKDEYTRIKAVHDYIVNNIKYDYSYKKYSAYNAIIDKSVVCQGYASLTYKMLKDLGIGVRVITGSSSSGQGHAWNIARINGLWYNIDNTWDSNLSEGGVPSSYYLLKNEDDFEGHYRDSQFKTSDFYSSYPMSQYSYKVIDDEDFNGDYEVNIEYLAQIASRYNVAYCDNNWNKKYDLNQDGIIDIYDIVMVASKL